ncbi:hypothetical protein JRQ81_005440 [Phrynocephalus forsythii]|uniref:Uncharacterized protein n=1 Tax=Phrynocephalus forsythii TaxID=171643 RepID=A0A9Q0Y408_9SAUR|nr:hypothetical protein JRQ81_005440 [Phrynocephalus forsythii]
MGVLFSSLSSVLLTVAPKPTSNPEDMPLVDQAWEWEPWWTPYFLASVAAAAAALFWWFLCRRRGGRVYYAQVRTSGKTGGCETQFLKEVSKLLSQRGVSLRLMEFTRTSQHLLLLFCPIASRMGTDLENALEGEQKTLLVVMHYVSKGNTDAFVDPRQVSHPAVLQTIHTRYTLPDGIYRCKLNMAAVVEMADAINDLAKGH